MYAAWAVLSVTYLIDKCSQEEDCIGRAIFVAVYHLLTALVLGVSGYSIWNNAGRACPDINIFRGCPDIWRLRWPPTRLCILTIAIVVVHLLNNLEARHVKDQTVLQTQGQIYDYPWVTVACTIQNTLMFPLVALRVVMLVCDLTLHGRLSLTCTSARTKFV